MSIRISGSISQFNFEHPPMEGVTLVPPEDANSLYLGTDVVGGGLMQYISMDGKTWQSIGVKPTWYATNGMLTPSLVYHDGRFLLACAQDIEGETASFDVYSSFNLSDWTLEKSVTPSGLDGTPLVMFARWFIGSNNAPHLLLGVRGILQDDSIIMPFEAHPDDPGDLMGTWTTTAITGISEAVGCAGLRLLERDGVYYLFVQNLQDFSIEMYTHDAIAGEYTVVYDGTDYPMEYGGWCITEEPDGTYRMTDAAGGAWKTTDNTFVPSAWVDLHLTQPGQLVIGNVTHLTSRKPIDMLLAALLASKTPFISLGEFTIEVPLTEDGVAVGADGVDIGMPNPIFLQGLLVELLSPIVSTAGAEGAEQTIQWAVGSVYNTAPNGVLTGSSLDNVLAGGEMIGGNGDAILGDAFADYGDWWTLSPTSRIVFQSNYPPNLYINFAAKYDVVQAIKTAVLAAGGAGYSVNETMKVGQAQDCTVDITVVEGAVDTLFVNDGGTNYIVGDVVIVTGGDSGCTATVTTVDPGGVITLLTKTANGTGYSAGNGVATSTVSTRGRYAELTVTEIDGVAGTVNTIAVHSGAGGLLYEQGDTITLTATGNGDCTATVASVSEGGVVTELTLAAPGTGYSAGSALVTTTDGSGAGLTVDITCFLGAVTDLEITDRGEGYYPGSAVPTGYSTGTGCTVDITNYSGTVQITVEITAMGSPFNY